MREIWYLFTVIDDQRYRYKIIYFSEVYITLIISSERSQFRLDVGGYFHL